MKKPQPRGNPHETPLYSWRADRRASIEHVKEAVRHALWEKNEIGTKTDSWYEGACGISRKWRDDVRASSVKQLARAHLEYWRLRAFMLGDGTLTGWHIDRAAFNRWKMVSERKTVKTA